MSPCLKGLKISDFKDKGEKEIAEIVRKTTHRMPGVEAFTVAMLNLILFTLTGISMIRFHRSDLIKRWIF